MGIGAETKLFRYIFRSTRKLQPFTNIAVNVLANAETTSLTLGGINNFESPPLALTATAALIIPLASRGGSIHPAARVAVIQFTGDLPPGLVTRRQSICVLTPEVFNQYQPRQLGTFRGLPVELVHKIDGRPDIEGNF